MCPRHSLLPNPQRSRRMDMKITLTVNSPRYSYPNLKPPTSGTTYIIETKNEHRFVAVYYRPYFYITRDYFKDLNPTPPIPDVQYWWHIR